MCSTDYDQPSFYYTERRRARKEHICYECKRIIKRNENYHYICGKWEGKISTYKTCCNCIVPQEWLQKECGGFLIGGLEEEIQEHAIEYKKMFLYRWLIGIRRQWEKKR